VDYHKGAIESIRSWPLQLFGKTSAEIEILLAVFLNQTFDSFEEFQEEADAVRNSSLLQCMTMMENAKKQETQEAELAALKAAQPKPEPTPEPVKLIPVDQKPAIASVILSDRAPTVEPVKVQESPKAEPAAVVDSPKPDPRETETVTITQKEYDYLVERDEWLEALEQTGVDNWSGWDCARELLNEWKAERGE
jgi:hypothetical protein